MTAAVNDILDPDRIGWRATIRLPGGKLTTSHAMQRTVIEQIASAFEVDPTSVIIEPHLSRAGNLATIMVLTTNPLETNQVFTAPSLNLDTGFFNAGIYADGSIAPWRLWTPGSGANHGLVAGTTGSGKSGFLNVLCTEVHLCDRTVLWLGDPDNGASVPDWQDAADWYAGGVTEIQRMLIGAYQVMRYRMRSRGRQNWTDDKGRERRGRGWFTPTPEFPQLVVVIDESPDALVDDLSRAIVARIVKKGRKVGVSIILVTQVPSVSELGGDITIRSMISSTNVAMFRTSDRLSKHMGIPADLPIDPANLPVVWPNGESTAGLGYLVGAGNAQRVSMLRGLYIDDPYDYACQPPGGHLDAGSADAAGPSYETWRDRRDAEDDDDQDELEALINGDSSSPARTTIPLSSGPGRSDAKATRDAIVTYLQSTGMATTGVIAAAIGAGLSTVSQHLNGRKNRAGEKTGGLLQEGLVERVADGMWRVSDLTAAREEAELDTDLDELVSGITDNTA